MSECAYHLECRKYTLSFVVQAAILGVIREARTHGARDNCRITTYVYTATVCASANDHTSYESGAHLPSTHSPGQPVGDVHVEQSGGSRLSSADAAAEDSNDANKKATVAKPVAERMFRALGTEYLEFECCNASRIPELISNETAKHCSQKMMQNAED